MENEAKVTANTSEVCIQFDGKCVMDEVENLIGFDVPGRSLDAYAIMKESMERYEYTSNLYKMYISAFLKILKGNEEVEEIMHDILSMPLLREIEFGLINSFIEAVIWKIDHGECVARYEVFVEGLCRKIDKEIIRKVAYWQDDDGLMNMMFDFLILSLRLIEMFLEQKVCTGDQIPKEKQEIYGFSNECLYEAFMIISKAGELEDDLVFVFKTVLSIDLLVSRSVPERIEEVLGVIERLPISNKNLGRIIVQITGVCAHDAAAFKGLMLSVFTTNSLVALNAFQRNELMDVLVEIANRNPKSEGLSVGMTDILKTIFYRIRDSESNLKYKMVWNFLLFLSKVVIERDVKEINGFFLRFAVRHPETIELYSEFVLINRIDFPVHTIHQSIRLGFMQRFYPVLFDKVRAEHHDVGHVDGLVSEFLKFFVATKNKDLIQALSLVPYIPVKREMLYVLYEIYSFVFEKCIFDCIGNFPLKTPALVGISSSIYYDVKHLPRLSRDLGVSGVEPRMLVFLGIIYHCESRKLHNLNFSGILEYIQDEDGIRMTGDGLVNVIRHIHEGYVSRSHAFTLSYVNSLLEIAQKPKTIETTLVMIETILRKLLERDEKIVFTKEIHHRFQRLFEAFGYKKFLNVCVIESYRELYKTILETIKCAPNFYNYVILCVADISFFDKEFPKGLFRSFNDLYIYTLSRMNVVEGFPDVFIVNQKSMAISSTSESNEAMDGIDAKHINKMSITDAAEMSSCKPEGCASHIHINQIKNGVAFGNAHNSIKCNEKDNVCMKSDQLEGMNDSMKSASISQASSGYAINIEILDKSIRHQEKSVIWLIDTIYTRRAQSNVIRMALDLLKLRLRQMFEYEDLYILLKAYNILRIRENDSEGFLKQALYRGLDFKTDSMVCYNLSVETNGFYRFFFRSLHWAVSGHVPVDNLMFPDRAGLFLKFDTSDLIYIQNAFRQNMIQRLLEKSSVPSYRSYFFNMNNLEVMDCLTMIQRLKAPSAMHDVFLQLQKLKNEMFFYVPQLVQALRNRDAFENVSSIINMLASDDFVSHQLVWNLKANLYNDVNMKIKDDCHDVFSRCIQQILNNMSTEAKEVFMNEEEFTASLLSISCNIAPYIKASKDEKRRRINEYLSCISLRPGVYIPYSPEWKIIEVINGSARVLQSHSKVPFVVSLKVQNGSGQVCVKQLIFKHGDDCRQDMLALQIISMFELIFKQANLDIFLCPYKVIVTSCGTGIIEVIPNSKSRDQIGRENINNLSEYFEYKFGFKESEGYLSALYNFASSLAGYSLVVYFLNIKDRHNGNIMIDDKGRIIHIDFGYMLETSPGNLNIEAPMKLTKEIEELLGGVSGKGFEIYQELMVKGFLALRRNSKNLVMIVDSFVESKLPCYKKNAVENFILRFRHELSDKNAKRFIMSLIAESSQKFRTWMYDQYQKLTNNISF
ncbi:phosphoinositide 4-kinase [Ordospora colligata OC4]|uniref:1-phosphatidylinositol 4-kinase n=1 Tax=Ordospora colligata OC4 TaxID=1354746 RepID=A0A0B2UIM4_9MICR|nr:phosphoinositide 4-kinase [Ordospora colligata OC4]KHN68810.1 phosphoinositide 4-kinase [Ordospora colligata OC4]